MGAWGYDENGWPSGFGDGMVNGMGESYQQKYLRYAFTDSPDSSSERTIVLLPWKEGYLHFYYDVNPFYVDTLDPKVTQAFLQKVHERYKAELGGDFSKFAWIFHRRASRFPVTASPGLWYCPRPIESAMERSCSLCSLPSFSGRETGKL